jgi:hypothetical protein
MPKAYYTAFIITGSGNFLSIMLAMQIEIDYVPLTFE